MANKLSGESSPYLLQHRDNPVDWYPWTSEALAKAQDEEKPIFLSIGYSTCHWCHVMEHESFEDDDVAALMNEYFVSIKVDREERPDIDQIYMNVCQLVGQHCGWPLNVVLTPDLKPFFVGTYFPRNSVAGRIGMLDLVPRIGQAWANDRSGIEQSANEITTALGSMSSIEGSSIDRDWLTIAVQQLSTSFDRAGGGFSSRPKFPSPHNLLFLLRQAEASASSEDVVGMVTLTLDRMATGGLHDHVGGGFHRYSTDAEWRLPHFEKMLYDQAMLLMAYSEAFQKTGFRRYRDTAEGIIGYVSRDLKSDTGTFYSAEDADSEGREGKFYVWTHDQFVAAAGGDELADQFDVRPDGNFAEEATGKYTGENVLYMTTPGDIPDSDTPLYSADEAEILDNLLEQRTTRIRPGLDTKVLTDWNGLMIAALAIAGRTLSSPDAARLATDAANVILTDLQSEGVLAHTSSEVRHVDGMLDDYAFMLWGLVELHQTTYEAKWLTHAVKVAEVMASHFEETDNGGLFFTRQDATSLIVRSRDFSDGALPSGNAVAAYNLLRLHHLTGEVRWRDIAHRTLEAAGGLVGRYPSAYTAMLIAAGWALHPTKEIVVLADSASTFGHEVSDFLSSRYDPFSVTHVIDSSVGIDRDLAAVAPFVETQVRGADAPAVFVCKDFACHLPVHDLTALAENLDQV